MPPRLRFGIFTLHPFERKLLANGQPITLGSRAIDLLLALVQRRGEVVSKSELFQSAWPGLVVEDNNLAVQMSVLRKTLGRASIVNVARLGYRFCLPVEELPGDVASASSPAPSLAPPPSPATATDPRATDPLAPLPMPPELMFGRATDSAELDQLMQQHHLVAIVGPAGVGKTALAMVVAQTQRDALRDGAVWIDLAAIRQPALVPRLLIQALCLPAAGHDNALSTLLQPLRRLQVLVVFDNAEHLADAVAELACAVLAAAPGVRMLVTSQSALRVTAERVFGLEPLAVPRDDCSLEEARTHGALALLVDEALRVERHFVLDERNLANVIALCRQLDGLPLAIKLAAARLPMFGIEGLRSRLADRFSLLRAQAPDLSTRHQTLRAALDWSHGLLSPHAQRAFRRLSVFAGGFSLELALATVSDESQGDGTTEDMLEVLAHHSLLAIDVGSTPRYRMLYSTREYARLELESSGESDAIHRRHAQAMLALFRKAGVEFWELGDAKFLSIHGPEIDNVRIALDWCLKNDGPLGIALLGEAADLFITLLALREYRELLAAYAPWASHALPAEVLGRYHLELSRVTAGGDAKTQHESSLAATRIFRELGDTRQLYRALGQVATSFMTPLSEAREAMQEQVRLEQQGWPPKFLRLRTVSQALVFSREGHHVAACEAVRASLAHSQRAGSDRLAAIDTMNLAYCHHVAGNTTQAVSVGREVLGKQLMRESVYRITALGNLSTALLEHGEVAEARERVTEFFEHCRDQGWEGFNTYPNLYALLAVGESRFKTAARLIGHADHAHESEGPCFPTDVAEREQALRRIEQALEPALVKSLRAEGSAMDRETVCRLTLDTGVE